MRQIINLLDMNKGTIPYNITRYNDGETSIKLLSEPNRKYPVDVIARIRTWNDLMTLAQVGDILKRMEINTVLYLNYIVGSRTDRLFTFYDSFNLKIVADIINNINAIQVNILDPFSPRVLQEIKNSVGVTYMLDNYLNIDMQTIVVFPNEKAYDMYHSKIPDNIPVVTFKEDLEPNTEYVVGYHIMNEDVIKTALEDEERKYATFLVIDGLCDDASNLALVSKGLDEYGLHKAVCVTHLISASGIKNMVENYDFVAVSNSFNDWEKEYAPQNFHVIDVFSDKTLR